MKREILVYLTALEISLGILLIVCMWIAVESWRNVLDWLDGYMHRIDD